MVRLGTQS